MEKLSQKHKIWAGALMIIIVLMLSSIIGAILLDKERTTGGMDVLWTQKPNSAIGTNFYSNGSVIIDNPNDKEIRSINENGNVAWNYPYHYKISFSASSGLAVLIDQDNETRTLMCLDNGGKVIWAQEIPDATFSYIGDDGNIYVYAGGDGRSTGTAQTILCYGIYGSLKWNYSTVNGTLGIRLLCEDGTAILSHRFWIADDNNSGTVSLETDLISVSSDGAVVGRFMWPLNVDGMTDIEQADNGTLLSITRNIGNMTSDMTGLTESLVPIWTAQDQPFHTPWQGPGSIIYYFRTHFDQVDGQGNQKTLTTLYAYNTSDGGFVYQKDFDGSSSGGLWVVGDHVFAYGNNNQIWAIGPDGTANEVKNNDGWNAFGVYQNGLLFMDTYGVKLVGGDGSTAWQYDMDSAVLSVYEGENGTLIVVTLDAVTAIHKPAMSMTMTYMMGIVGIDILVVLTGSLWFLDIRSKKAIKIS